MSNTFFSPGVFARKVSFLFLGTIAGSSAIALGQEQNFCLNVPVLNLRSIASFRGMPNGAAEYLSSPISMNITNVVTGESRQLFDKGPRFNWNYALSPSCRYLVIVSAGVVLDLNDVDDDNSLGEFIDRKTPADTSVFFPKNQGSVAYLAWNESGGQISIAKLDLETGATAPVYAATEKYSSIDVFDGGIVIHDGAKLLFHEFVSGVSTELADGLEMAFFYPAAYSPENRTIAFTATKQAFVFDKPRPPRGGGNGFPGLGQAYSMPRRGRGGGAETSLIQRGIDDAWTFEFDLKTGQRRAVSGFPDKFPKPTGRHSLKVNEAISSLFYAEDGKFLVSTFKDSIYIEDRATGIVNVKKVNGPTAEDDPNYFSSTRIGYEPVIPDYLSVTNNLLVTHWPVSYQNRPEVRNSVIDLDTDTVDAEKNLHLPSYRAMNGSGIDMAEALFNHGMSYSKSMVLGATNAGSQPSFAYSTGWRDTDQSHFVLWAYDLRQNRKFILDELFHVSAVPPLSDWHDMHPVADPVITDDGRVLYMKFPAGKKSFDLMSASLDGQDKKVVASIEGMVFGNYAVRIDLIPGSTWVYLETRHGGNYSVNLSAGSVVKHKTNPGDKGEIYMAIRPEVIQ